MAASVDPQQGMFDREVEDGDLIAALEEREKRNNSRKAVAKRFKEQDERVKILLAGQDIEPGEVIRVGRFRVSKSERKGRSVSFDTSDSTQIRISLLPEPE